MGLLREKCIRCGKKTREHTAEGLPTCEECQARLQAEREEKRTCPVDGAVMAKDVIHNLVIDRCDQCGGVWLDGGELDLLKEVLSAGASEDIAHAMMLGMMR